MESSGCVVVAKRNPLENSKSATAGGTTIPSVDHPQWMGYTSGHKIRIFQWTPLDYTLA
jgi:hypothetical protein